jgi:hypothetical protein
MALVVTAAVLASPWATAQDIRAIQAREAQKADERTLAYLARFKAALIAKSGTDPQLTMLEWSENEAQALVVDAGGHVAHVIWQEGKWIGTDGRQLKPWAPAAPAASQRFALSAVREEMVRDKLRAHRAQPKHGTDFLGPVRVGYFAKPFDRQIVEIQVLSLTGGGMSAIQFDLATGASLDVDGAISAAKAEKAAKAKAQAAPPKAAPAKAP